LGLLRFNPSHIAPEGRCARLPLRVAGAVLGVTGTAAAMAHSAAALLMPATARSSVSILDI
jgi:hypothetical protein